MRGAFTIVLLCVAAPASAQRFEIAPVAGFTSHAPIDSQTPGLDGLEIASSMTYGAQVAARLSTHLEAEGLWTWQHTNVHLSTAASAAPLFFMDVNQFDGNLVYAFGEPEMTVRPFVFGGLGAGLMDATSLERDWKLTWNVGGGAKWFFRRNVGLRVDGRYKPTRLGTSPSDYCVPFSFCQASLRTFQVHSALLLRF
jgi:hypothetical protein